jgi:mono/diheme cytochrome c family protein
MQQFTDGRRTNNEDMPKVMHDISENDRQAMAHYLAAL